MFEISTTTAEIDRAFFFIFAVSMIFLIGITFAMVYFVVRYNRKRHPIGVDIEGHLGLEITWSVIPTLLSLGMFYYGWLGFQMVRNVPAGATEVTATARSFFWMFEYDGGKQSPELYLPLGAPVKVLLKSTDVNHSFFLPAYSVKEDCIPGRENYISFTPLKVGIYDIMCAEFCGVGHSSMNSRLIVLEPKEFDEWLRQPQSQRPLEMKDATAASAFQMERGEKVFLLNCATCHGFKGTGDGMGEARDMTTLKEWKNGSKVSEIFRTLNKGLGKKMPSFGHIPVDDRFAVIHYVRHFASGHPTDTPEAILALDQEFSISKGKMPPPRISIESAMEKLVEEASSSSADPVRARDKDAMDALRASQPEGAGPLHPVLRVLSRARGRG